MKRAVLVALLALVATAGADDNKTSAAAGDLFARAEEAASAGELSRAIDLYERSFRIAPHANTAYNLADALERNQSYTEAIVYYELYLALAPKATDRAQVRRTITALEARPTTFEISGDGSDDSVDLRRAYVLVDGTIVKKPGGSRVDIKLAPGFHTIDIVTATAVTSQEVEVRRSGGAKPFQPAVPTPTEGNVVISTSVVEAVYGRDKIDRTAKRLVVPAGKRLLGVYDDRHECKPVTITVGGGHAAVTYVHVALATPDNSSRSSMKRPERCRKLRVLQHTLAFK